MRSCLQSYRLGPKNSHPQPCWNRHESNSSRYTTVIQHVVVAAGSHRPPPDWGTTLDELLLGDNRCASADAISIYGRIFLGTAPDRGITPRRLPPPETSSQSAAWPPFSSRVAGTWPTPSQAPAIREETKPNSKAGGWTPSLASNLALPFHTAWSNQPLQPDSDPPRKYRKPFVPGKASSSGAAPTGTAERRARSRSIPRGLSPSRPQELP